MNSAGVSLEYALTISDSHDRLLLRAATLAPASAPELLAVTPLADELSVDAGTNRYRTSQVLGAGGMGEVRLCHDGVIGREVALKTLLPEREGSTDAARRFLREARVQGQLEHPSTVPVYDLGADPSGALFFTMRRVRGHTLGEILEALSRGDAAMAGSYSRRKLLGAFSRVCLAVDYAHARGILHRDPPVQSRYRRTWLAECARSRGPGLRGFS